MPFTVNRYLNVPATGDLPGAWGTTAVNANMSALDGILGGFATISLSSATTFVLSLPTGAATGLSPGAGPSQSQNALLKFTGTLSGNAVVQFTMPGFYIVHNACTVGAFYIQLAPASGGGNSVCAPPGRKCHVFFDGTDMDYVDMPEVGSALDLHQSTTTMPAWIANCTVRPYLIKDGTVYNVSTYPQLGARLGSTFGGNGATTFGVPDELQRVRLPIDPGNSVARITTVIGNFMGAAGGDQNVQQHNHDGTTGNDTPDHMHATVSGAIYIGDGGGPPNSGWGQTGAGFLGANSGGASVRHVHPFSTNNYGTGGSRNIQPSIVSFLPLIKT